MGKTPKVTVGEDFSYIVKNYLHEKFAKQLSKEEKKGNIRFQVIRDLGLDGQTNFGERGVIIQIKKDVVKSKFKCWRRAVVCHELGHALHFFETNGQIREGEEHGTVWKNMMASAYLALWAALPSNPTLGKKSARKVSRLTGLSPSTGSGHCQVGL